VGNHICSGANNNDWLGLLLLVLVLGPVHLFTFDVMDKWKRMLQKMENTRS